MHVLLVPSWYKTPSRPVVGSFFEEQARLLMDLGHRVGVLYPLVLRFRDRAPGGLNQDIRRAPPDTVDRGLPIYYYFFHDILPWSRRLNERLLLQGALRRAKAYVASHGAPDLIHSHAAFHGGVVGRHLSDELGVPLVHTEHLSLLVRGAAFTDAFHLERARSVFDGADCCIAVGTKFREDLCTTFGLAESDVEVIPNLVSPIFVDGACRKSSSSPFVYFTNSFLKEGKNHSLLFEAFREVVDRRPDSRLRVGGMSYDGFSDTLRARVKELGLQEHVAFLGELSRDAVVEELQHCHAFVLASRYETFGVVLIEALAVGRPVVSTESGGPRDIVTPADGLLVEKHEARDLALAMEEIRDRYAQFDQLDIASRCAARFSEKIIGARIERVYRRVMAAREHDSRRQEAPPPQPLTLS